MLHIPKGARRIKMGYALYIKRPGAKRWERVGFLFNNSREASEYRELHHASAVLWTINAIRVDCTPLVQEDKGHRA